MERSSRSEVSILLNEIVIAPAMFTSHLPNKYHQSLKLLAEMPAAGPRPSESSRVDLVASRESGWPERHCGGFKLSDGAVARGVVTMALT